MRALISRNSRKFQVLAQFARASTRLDETQVRRLEDASLKLDPAIPKGSAEMERDLIQSHETISPQCRVTISGRVDVDDTLSRPQSLLEIFHGTNFSLPSSFTILLEVSRVRARLAPQDINLKLCE